MSKAAYAYPPDEFDAPPDPDAPRGVHRAPRSAWSRWWPFLVVLVVVPVLAWGAVTLLAQQGRLPELPGGGQPTGQTTTEPADGETTTESTAPSTEPPATTEEPVVTEAPPNYGAPVSVLNGAGISGLAGRTAEKLEAAGFTAVTPGNAESGTPVASTVFYASEELKSTADLVASTIGVTMVELSPADAGDGVTVVLRTDPEA